MKRYKKQATGLKKSYTAFAVILTMTALYGCSGGGGGAVVANNNADDAAEVSVGGLTNSSGINISGSLTNSGTISGTIDAMASASASETDYASAYYAYGGTFTSSGTLENTGTINASAVATATTESFGLYIDSSIVGAWTGTLTNSGEISTNIFGVTYNGFDAQNFRLLIDSGECTGTEYSGFFSLDVDAASGIITGAGDIAGIAAPGCIFGNGSPTTIGIIDITISGDNLTGTYSTEGDSGTISLTYDSVSNTPITFADLEGDWVLFWDPLIVTDITIDSNGNFIGNDPDGCEDLTGQLDIDDPDSLLVWIEFSAANCNNPGIPVGTIGATAFLLFDDQDDVIYIMDPDNPLSNIF